MSLWDNWPWFSGIDKISGTDGRIKGGIKKRKMQNNYKHFYVFCLYLLSQ